MDITNINTALEPLFEILGIDPLSFHYDENSASLISDTSYTDNESDPQEYYIVIKFNNNIGTIMQGYTDGINFYDTKFLGRLVNNNDKWEGIF